MTASSAPTEAGRGISGTRLVVAALIFAAAFVAFLVTVSPRLLERTLAAAPPSVPHQVAAGPGWTATAVQRGENPCLLLSRSGLGEARLCTDGRERTTIQRVDAADLGDRTLHYGIVAPRVRQVRLQLAGGDAVVAAVAHADYGFPLGFWTAELPAAAQVHTVEALAADGEVAAVYQTPAYSGGQG